MISTVHDIKAAASYLSCEADSETWINEDQVSALLQIAIPTLKTWRRLVRPTIPYFKVGKNVRYRLGNVVDYWVSVKCKEEQKKRWGWLYIITSDEIFPVCKVGFTNRTPQRRIHDMSTSFPFEMYVFRQYKVLDPNIVERVVHGLVSHARMRGEWFRLSDKDLALIHQHVEIDPSRAKPTS